MQNSAKELEIIFRSTDPKHGIKCCLLIRRFINNGAVAEILVDNNLTTDKLRHKAEQIERRNTITGPAEGGAAIGLFMDQNDAHFEEVLDYFKTQIADFTDNGLTIVTSEIISPVLDDSRFFAGTKPIPVHEIINSWSMAECARHFYNYWGGNMNGKRLLLSEWNETTKQLAYYLSKHNAALIGFHYESQYYYNPQSWSVVEIEELIESNELPSDCRVSEVEFVEKIQLSGCEIFVSAYDERDEMLEKAIQNQGMELMLCSQEKNNTHLANYDNWLQLVDKTTSVIPNFISESGVGRLHYLFSRKDEKYQDAREYLKDVSEMVEAALVKIHQFNIKSTGVSSKSTEIAEKMSLTG
jgi:hypothetical protein